MWIGPTRPLLLASLLGLALAAGPVLAQPADNPGRGQGQGKAPGQQRQQAQPQQHEREPQRDREYWREWGRESRGEVRGEVRGKSRGEVRGGVRDERRDGPRLDEREVRRIFERRRDWITRDDRDSLPPGIRMNLERGKPLPPGIARNFDDRVLGELPHHDGYRWQRVGPDAVLVDTSNDIIHEVLRDILD
ncbi:anti-virulence regulator CigR family protein [Halomonas sp. EGI 63088]|uniref:Anti-virulence regulator CigR family protein n=1 Tax=Halomonas flagellata TaxID=2920385 RepID=A0ABS9RV22_9GAMM|nr:anti-virulence regulator CigR family protein [Halomonas flagellata]MCH4563667.1 anti-virulence regulator CigR family protein [Halomonas flagellata]